MSRAPRSALRPAAVAALAAGVLMAAAQPPAPFRQTRDSAGEALAAGAKAPRHRWPWHLFGHHDDPASHPAAPSAPVRAAPASAAAAAEYRLGAGDLLKVEVWHEAEISGTAPVRPDGKIALPLAGELQAAGLTPRQLREAITARLRAYIVSPAVTVIVERVNSRKINVLGRVLHPAAYELTGRTRVLDALSLAGGLAPFAHATHIYVLRRDTSGRTSRLRFNYKKVIEGADDAENIVLQPGDTVVVP